ncbi:hypothetical protein TI39_contig398g00012 [Zymoseptoria brevis]|uniref:Uncharacterized protein n=1 Tax=Zymoseptoria brevis TaxID=1047168 RepID=A0A0F4GMK7_9PEZI|nr:hypothetical protein TI39_contig398g00012 [Zymoseptoria brevis]
MPDDHQDLFKQLEAGGADLSNGVQGLMGGIEKATAALTAEQQLRMLQMTTLKEYNDLLKTFQQEAAARLPRVGIVTDMTDAKRKRNNQNKNKNRKLRMKEPRAGGVKTSMPVKAHLLVPILPMIEQRLYLM